MAVASLLDQAVERSTTAAPTIGAVVVPPNDARSWASEPDIGPQNRQNREISYNRQILPPWPRPRHRRAGDFRTAPEDPAPEPVATGMRRAAI